ncbi:hypothetical protein BGZ63DRAFT_422049 [Mariannaea sp. PMI_226]|nr:hypothetical protein BGZ63DRAFT_422049 [Mariannaea sp. PMI_226]
MASFTLKSAIIAMTMALTATATPQCATDADCLRGYICGSSDGPGGSAPVNVCVQLNTCTNAPDPQFPNMGPKCGDSTFCNVGGYCGSGYITLNGEQMGALVCVDQATGIKCAQPST